MYHRLFQRFCVDIGDERVRIADAIRFLREAWEKLKTKVIEAGWGIYEDEFGPLRKMILKTVICRKSTKSKQNNPQMQSIQLE
jgi:hypothetical protein